MPPVDEKLSSGEVTPPYAQEDPIHAASLEDEDHSPECDPSSYPSGWVLSLILSADALAAFLVALDMTIVTIAIPEITHQFDSVKQVGWYGSAFYLTVSAFQHFWGKLYRHLPVRSVFLTTTVLFEAGSLVCALAENPTMLIAGRALQGLGAAGILSGCYIIISLVVTPPNRAAATGVISAVFSLASVAGPLLGGFLTQYASWRWCFYINLPVGGAAVATMAIFLRNPGTPDRVPIRELLLSIDAPGIAVLLGALTCFLCAMEWGGVTAKWSSGQVVATLVVFVVLATIFAGIQAFSGERSSLVVRIIRNKPVYVSCIFIFFQAGANFVFQYYIPILFQSIDSKSAARSGILTLPNIAGSAAFSIVSGALVGRFGRHSLFMIIGSAIFTVGAGLFCSVGLHTSLAQYIGYQLLLGIGVGLNIQIPMIAVQAESTPIDIPNATATVLFFQIMGGAVCVSAGESIFNNLMIQRVIQTNSKATATLVLDTGSNDLNSVFSGEQLDSILHAYLHGLKGVFAFGTAAGAFSLFIAFFAPFYRARR